MDSQMQMILMLGLFGMLTIGISVLTGPIIALFGGFLCLLPSFVLYLNVKKSGLLQFLLPQKRGETIVLYFSPTRRIFPMIGRELLERYIKLPGYGRIRVTRNSDYMLGDKKVVLAKTGVSHTIPLEMASAATKLKEMGFRNLDEVKEKLEEIRFGQVKEGD
jgi:hypothetical protein